MLFFKHNCINYRVALEMTGSPRNYQLWESIYQKGTILFTTLIWCRIGFCTGSSTVAFIIRQYNSWSLVVSLSGKIACQANEHNTRSVHCVH